jgi:type IV secretory pathway VirB2 component (pilin)
MKANRILQIAAPMVPLMAGVAHAAGGGASPMAGVFTTVESWLTGDIAEWLGICAIVGLGALIWFAHDYGHIFGYVFKGILAIAVVVFAITEYTTAFGGGASIGGTAFFDDVRWVAQIAGYTTLAFVAIRYGLLAARLIYLRGNRA